MTKIKSILAASAAIAALGATAPAIAAQVFTQDVVVQGSLCVGVDCPTSPSFGFDTVRLQENNLRIHFDDTSSSASFPKNDWRIEINDSSNGGAEYFRVADATAGTSPFTVQAGAGNNAVYIESGGFVGFGNSNPVVDLHVTQGNSPTLRLEQDGSSGFQSQTWDLAGNETNFFLRDVTNSSDLPFRVFPGTGDDSLVLRNGRVGVGLDNPQATIEIQGTAGTSQILIDENSATNAKRDMLVMSNVGNPQLVFENLNNNNTWHLGAGNSFEIENRTTATEVFEVDSAGNVTIPGSITTGGGTCGGGCDAVFSAAYALPSIQEHSEAMWSNGYLPNVGPTIEGEPVNMTEKVGRMLNELETAHVFIDQLNGELGEANARIARLEALIDQ